MGEDEVGFWNMATERAQGRMLPGGQRTSEPRFVVRLRPPAGSADVHLKHRPPLLSSFQPSLDTCSFEFTSFEVTAVARAPTRREGEGVDAQLTKKRAIG